MTTHQTRLVGGVAALAILAWTIPVPAQEPTVFRAATDLVSVDVSVRSGRSPVRGLVSSDFALTDNGVPQQIDAVTVELVAVDLTLVLDISDSTSLFTEDFKARAQTINTMLRPGDRVRLVTVAMDVTEVFGLRPGADRLPVDAVQTRAGTSLNDALALSLARGGNPGRRQLIIAFTDGVDTSSVIDTATVAGIARRANGVLHLVLSGGPGDQLPPSGATLRAAAEATGGELYRPGALSNAIDAFKQIFDDFRQSYVLRYSARGVRRDGWHEIAVTVVKPANRKDIVRARKGYFGG